ncbi:hypothetical protein [Oryzobacter terrae]|uniref:hypothetical protein n=1 Tax=Oryzobacter terrae TaxID=1620385 RepID=UPI00366A828D
MHASMRRGLQIALVVGGGIFFSAQAQADDTTGVESVLGGNQAVVTVEAPVTVAGSAVSVLGDSSSSGSSSSSPSRKAGSSSTTSGEDSAGGGNQAVVAVTAPVTVSGTAVSVVGDSDSEDSTTAVGAEDAAPVQTGDTSGEDSVGGGNQAVADVVAPVTVGGTAVSVVGDSHTEGAQTASSGGAGADAGDASTSGEESVLGGNQGTAPVTAPVSVGGTAVSLVGDATSSGATTSGGAPSRGSTGGGTTGGEDSVLGGNQATAPVTAPVTVGGNAVSVVGDASTEGGTTTPGGTGPSVPVDPTDPGVPTDPADPVDTSGPGEVVDDATPAGSSSGSASTRTVSRVATADGLARTGAEAAPLLAAALALVLLGALLLGASRPRAVVAG